MRSAIHQLFVDIYDSLMEPPGSGNGIDHHACTPMAGLGLEPGEPAWHNHWGTAPDFQALSDNLEMVSCEVPAMTDYSSASSMGQGSLFE
jgi:hypothetical protein